METGPLHPLVKDYYQKCHFNTSLYLSLSMFNLWSQIKTKAFYSYILEWQERIRWTSSKILDSKWITVLSSGNPSGYPKMMANIHLAGGGESKIIKAGVEMFQTQVAFTIWTMSWRKRLLNIVRVLHRLVALLPCYCIAVVSGTGDDDLYSGFGKEDVAPALATHDLEYDPAFQVSLAFKWQHNGKFWISQDRDWKKGGLVKWPLIFT